MSTPLKILKSSDWHLDAMTHGVRRFDELHRAVKETVEAAIDQNVNLYAFTGDLCDPESGSIVFECIEVAVQTATQLARAGIPSVWLKGNHDVIEDGRGRSTLAPLVGLHDLVHVFETGTAKRLYDTRGCFGIFDCIALPYPSATKPYAFDDVFASYKPTIDAPLIVFSHLTVPSVQPGEEVGELARGRDVLHPTERVVKLFEGGRRGAMLQGHYHRQQSLNFGGIYMHISGSLARLTFSEEWHAPGYMIIEV